MRRIIKKKGRVIKFVYRVDDNFRVGIAILQYIYHYKPAMGLSITLSGVCVACVKQYSRRLSTAASDGFICP